MRKLIALLFLAAIAIVSWKLAPIVRDEETYNACFPAALFQAKLQKETPGWMQVQIREDFKEVPVITSDAVESTYWEIRERIGASRILHYRILDNKLYKFVGSRSEYRGRDTEFEKALKTLLLQTEVPDVDFLYCPMDGVPELYMPKKFFLTKNQSPIFAQAKIAGSRFIALIPDHFSLSKDWEDISQEILALNKETAWEQKEESAVWRGGLTDLGLPNGLSESVSSCPRYFISKLSNQYPASVDAGINWIWNAGDPMVPILEKEQIVKGHLTKREHLLHKYLPVLDGHMCTYPGYQWRLLSNSAAFKQDSDQIQWFYAALEPYRHFVPIQNDLSDLLERIEWAKEHDDEVQAISANAQEFARNNLMIEDDYLYLFLALVHSLLCKRSILNG